MTPHLDTFKVYTQKIETMASFITDLIDGEVFERQDGLILAGNASLKYLLAQTSENIRTNYFKFYVNDEHELELLWQKIQFLNYKYSFFEKNNSDFNLRKNIISFIDYEKNSWEFTCQKSFSLSDFLKKTNL